MSGTPTQNRPARPGAAEESVFAAFDEPVDAQPVPDHGRLANTAAALTGLIVFSVIAGLLAALAITPGIAVVQMTTVASTDVFTSLPSYIDVGRLPQRNRIFANGPSGPVQIATVYDQNREEASWSQVSPFLKDAAVDAEDKDFYSHGGVDVPSLIRAALGNFNSGSIQSGASTIAMQVVRNVQVQDALQLKTAAEQAKAYKAATTDSVARKLKEMKLAIGLEKSYSKNDVLLAYLNIANFGKANYGVEAAAQAYFSTNAADVTPAQAASIIAIVQSPTARNLGSAKNYQANETRRDFILKQMYADGDISKAQLATALATKVDASFVHPSVVSDSCLEAPLADRWMCDYVVHDVPTITALGSSKAQREKNWKLGGYDIYTTLNTSMQAVATNTLHHYVPNSETQFQLGGAVSTVQPGTGDILVMAENKDYNNTLAGGGRTTTAVNFNTDEDKGGAVGFQPGSSYKLFTLIDWLENGKGLNSVFNASVRSIPMTKFKDSCGAIGGPPYTFTNDENEQGGWTVMRATAQSVNSVFLQMAASLDLCDIKNIAMSLGVHNANGSPLSTLPSCVIGGCNNTIAPLTMAAAYAAIADKGWYCSPVAVAKIIGPGGKNLGGENANCHQAIPANIANTAATALQGVMKAGGTGVTANPNDGTPFMGKTGTTNDAEQTWIVSSSTKAATAVWIGNISGAQNLRSAYVGGIQAAVLRHVVFRTVMSYVDARLGRGAAFPPPDPALLKSSPTGYFATPPPKPKPHPAPGPTPVPTPPAPGG
ncbi:MAG TPA: transglycosylase domain-containing protein [Galbitalea sp.]|jgi:membrane peptidoglycan carboxypeptidase|nr:transglycosylase domain-containing protein [Galbitalea sp.]